MPPQQTLFLNPDPFQCWHGVENIARVRINGENCMALAQWHADQHHHA